MTNEILRHLNKKFFPYCPFTHSNFHFTSLLFFSSIHCCHYFMRKQQQKNVKWKITFWISHSFAFFRKNKSCWWKEGEVKWKIKQRKSFSFFPFCQHFSILYWERNENWGKAYFRSLSSLSTQRLFSLYSFTLCCLVKCLDWCFNFIPFI